MELVSPPTASSLCDLLSKSDVMLLALDWSSVSQSVIPRQTASASPGIIFKMQIFRPHSTPAESESMGVGPSNLFSQATQWPGCTLQIVKRYSRVLHTLNNIQEKLTWTVLDYPGLITLPPTYFKKLRNRKVDWLPQRISLNFKQQNPQKWMFK